MSRLPSSLHVRTSYLELLNQAGIWAQIMETGETLHLRTFAKGQYEKAVQKVEKQRMVVNRGKAKVQQN